MRQLYLSNRFFYLCGIVVLLFVTSYGVPVLYGVAIGALALATGLVLLDALLLWRVSMPVRADRKLQKVLSLGDENKVRIELSNQTRLALVCTVIDELPMQFQIRDFEISVRLTPLEQAELTYRIRPVIRGAYEFGLINVFVENTFRWAKPLGFLQRRLQLGREQPIAVYPSVLQMKQFELTTQRQISSQQGMHRIRRIGHSYEFEQIKEYVRGDDYRSINWKATSRRQRLMVNQYEDERSQQVYSILDKSRVMRMPFDDLSLLDHAINSTLAFSNIVLKKYDKAGLITFSDKLGTVLKADRKSDQLHRILQHLYNEKERPLEANYELLYHVARKLIHGRSLLMLYTNFESTYALERVLPMLRSIGHLHLLVVIFFVNTEVEYLAHTPAHTLQSIYTQAVAQQFLQEKMAMVHTLRQHGIQAVLTRPQHLTANTINKYLELKARQLI